MVVVVRPRSVMLTHDDESITLALMSVRLQVLLPDDEWREIRRIARTRRMTVAEWVRQALREVRQRQPETDGPKKLAVIRGAARHAFPTADIDRMLADIERGYTGG
jgi:hypothetical protein